MNLRSKFKGLKWWMKAIIVWIGITLLWNHLPYYYDPEGAADYAANHHAAKSHSMCAGYVMRAMILGGKCPMGLLPAYAYAETLPQMGFKEVKDGSLKKGDIAVMPQNEFSAFGHIAIYTGEDTIFTLKAKGWVSDYKQTNFNPWKSLKNVKYKIFRAEKGWHWKHVWTHPGQWWGWIKSVAKGWLKL